MRKVLIVAREELAFHLRQWSFYASLALMVGIFAALGAFPQLRRAASASPLGDVETVFTVDEAIMRPTGIVDHAGVLVDVAGEENLVLFGSEEDAIAALELGEIDRVYVVTADYMETGEVTGYSLEAQLIVGSDSPVTQVLRRNLLRQLDDPFLGERLRMPVRISYDGPPIPVFSFVPPDLDSGRLVAAGIIGAFFAFLINMSGALLLRAIQRESEARVLEIVITSTTPGQFIGGKLLGLSTLVVIQAGLTLLGGLLVYGQNPDGSGPAGLPAEVIPVVILYLLFGYLAYSGLMLAIASLWPMLAESTQLQFFLRFALLTPLVGGVFILPNADGPLAVVLTMIPVASPLLMPFRVMITAVPPWQIGLSLLLLLLWAWFLLWLSTRLFRAHGLLTGRTPMLRAVWWALAGR